jgi:hypothetical protein
VFDTWYEFNKCLINVESYKLNKSFFSFFVCVGLQGLNSGLYLEQLHQPFFVMGFLQDRVVSGNIYLSWGPPDLCLLSS